LCSGSGVEICFAEGIHLFIEWCSLDECPDRFSDRSLAWFSDSDDLTVRIFLLEIVVEDFGLGGLACADGSFEADIHRYSL